MNLLKDLIAISLRIENLLSTILHSITHQRSGDTVPGAGQWLDKQDILLKLHISESTLKRLRWQGKLPYTSINGKYYYRETDLEQLLNNNRKYDLQ